MQKDVIIALDFKNLEETTTFLKQFGDLRPYVKVGMELFYAEGFEIIKFLKKHGHKVFLDLKLHDIPNTVKKTATVINEFNVDMFTVHAAGGIEMMKAANEVLDKTLVIAVSQLTSTDEHTLVNELLIDKSMEDVILKYATNAKAAGCDGIVCSALEAEMIHKNLGDDFLTITPGIRSKNDFREDQSRIATPSQAKKLGSNYIVVGRPITESNDPVGAYNKFVKGFIGS